MCSLTATIILWGINSIIHTANLSDRIIDWDSTWATPLLGTIQSLNQNLFECNIYPEPERHRNILDEQQDTLFLKELYRICKERSSSDRIAKLYRDSERNLFLFIANFLSNEKLAQNIIDHRLRNLLKEALKRSPTRLARAAEEWEKFTDGFFKKRGRPVPDWPIYVEIQEDLGLYRNGRVARLERLLKRAVHEQLKASFEVICLRYPQWKWAARKHCYYTAALWNEYKLPSGLYSC